jgi:hypothetical protein
VEEFLEKVDVARIQGQPHRLSNGQIFFNKIQKCRPKLNKKTKEMIVAINLKEPRPKGIKLKARHHYESMEIL